MTDEFFKKCQSSGECSGQLEGKGILLSYLIVNGLVHYFEPLLDHKTFRTLMDPQTPTLTGPFYQFLQKLNGLKRPLQTLDGLVHDSMKENYLDPMIAHCDGKVFVLCGPEQITAASSVSHICHSECHSDCHSSLDTGEVPQVKRRGQRLGQNTNEHHCLVNLLSTLDFKCYCGFLFDFTQVTTFLHKPIIDPKFHSTIVSHERF